MLSNPDEVQQYVECIVRLHMRVHALPAVHLADLKVRLTDNIVATGVLAEPRRRDLPEGIARMPDGDRLCHGDFHPMNILGEPSPVIIDWPDARRGDPAADVCRSYLLMKLHAAEIAPPISTATAEQLGYRVRLCPAGCHTWQLPGSPSMFLASSMTC